ncbi:hypothetical protein KL86DES1_10664 [uncultured Desulfovibrio sp.]|uniref:Uncharacterized protein n=1 Tax=uncultured Desulfovibrio sp. TaxID=167968 RepID=A0A212KZU1_9BACT|nr:hypothetical protein KL86DES1_10664 [uncultured Desulfovibrio sp.]VZH32537.1 conserved protein of unknown function [Desulfovibrio sp. 86]
MLAVGIVPEHFGFEIALADAGADARRKGASAQSVCAACPMRGNTGCAVQ